MFFNVLPFNPAVASQDPVHHLQSRAHQCGRSWCTCTSQLQSLCQQRHPAKHNLPSRSSPKKNVSSLALTANIQDSLQTSSRWSRWWSATRAPGQAGGLQVGRPNLSGFVWQWPKQVTHAGTPSWKLDEHVPSLQSVCQMEEWNPSITVHFFGSSARMESLHQISPPDSSPNLPYV